MVKLYKMIDLKKQYNMKNINATKSKKIFADKICETIFAKSFFKEKYKTHKVNKRRIKILNMFFNLR